MPERPPQINITHLALGDLEHEVNKTRQVLERVPDEHLDWRPHEKSFSLGELASHVANLLHWQVMTLTRDGIDLAAPMQGPDRSSRDAILRNFDETARTLRRTVDATDEDTLLQPWTLRNGDHVIFTRPRLAVMREFGVSHMIHHRGQLTVYLRMVGVPVPGMFGPSADEKA